MHRIVVIEPDPVLRHRVRHHLDTLSDRADVAASVEEAQELAWIAGDVLVVARGDGPPEAAARLACAFDLSDGVAPGTRLVVLGSCAGIGTDAAATSAYLHEVDRIIARMMLPPAERRDAGALEPRLAPDFPLDAYQPLAHLGETRAANVFLVRNRVSGCKELLVQVEDSDEEARPILASLYRSRGRKLRADRSWPSFRHEIAALYSFVACDSLPFDLTGAWSSGASA